MKSHYGNIFLLFLALLLLAADLCIGDIPLGELDVDVFEKLRLPRALSALLAGASLSLAGLQMQSIFRNPLADPHIMGVSAGAGTGAAIATLMVGSALPVVLQGMTMAVAAFAGALLTSILVMAVASHIRSTSALLLFGVMLGFVFSAITSILEYSANAESLKAFYSWSAGSFSGNRISELGVMAAAFAIALVMACINHKGLDISLFGDEYAALTGTDIRKVRNLAMIGSCILAGSVTAFCGPLGFVGIVSPHIARAVLRTSVHSRLIPGTIAVGMIISLLADILSQVTPSPLPVGSTMAIIGIPIILSILLRHKDA